MRKTNSTLFNSLRMLLALTAFTGLIYPLAMTALARAMFRERAGGSLILNRDGTVMGSRLIAQKFENPKFLWPRPSTVDFNPTPSGGSNLGPTSRKLKEFTDRMRERYRAFSGPGEIPEELLFASASGLDPHLSLEAALFQAPRIAQARNRQESEIHERLRRSADHGQVNVLEFNHGMEFGTGP